MEIPGFKAILQKLSVLKNNSSLLVALIIAMIGIVLLIPAQLMSSKLKAQIKAGSVQKGESIQRQLQGMNAVPREQWKEEQKRQQFYAEDANQIRDIAKQTTQRELLSYKIFPEPADTSALIYEDFGKQFRAGIEQLIAKVSATDCPLDTEIERALQSTSTRSRFGMRRPPSRTSLSSYYGRSSRLMSDIDMTIIDEICRGKAKSGSVYAHTADISGYEYWREYQFPGKDQAVKDCWYWQLGYWIIEDVIDTIDSMNAGSDSVLTSPVKRLMNTSFMLKDRMFGRRRPTRGRLRAKKSLEDKPGYVLSEDEVLTKPCSARFSNEDIDVIHFNVIVLVRADAVLPFMQQLCSAKEHKFRGYPFDNGPEQTFEHNQIMILESSVQSVDTEGFEHADYRYGEAAVVELDLICEYIFNKTGYEDITPESIKEDLNPEEE